MPAVDEDEPPIRDRPADGSGSEGDRVHTTFDLPLGSLPVLLLSIHEQVDSAGYGSSRERAPLARIFAPKSAPAARAPREDEVNLRMKAQYFLFYVLERYVGIEGRYAGIIDLGLRLWRRRW